MMENGFQRHLHHDLKLILPFFAWQLRDAEKAPYTVFSGSINQYMDHAADECDVFHKMDGLNIADLGRVIPKGIDDKSDRDPIQEQEGNGEAGTVSNQEKQSTNGKSNGGEVDQQVRVPSEAIFKHGILGTVYKSHRSKGFE